eukprot:c19580_g1_i2 orf=137-487(+)
MVGMFPRFHGSKSILGYRFLSPPDEKRVSADSKEAPISQVTYGGEPNDEVMPVEQPIQPSEKDQPVRCPLPEPCIIHDGRIWKERIQLNVKRRGDNPFGDSGSDNFHQRQIARNCR